MGDWEGYGNEPHNWFKLITTRTISDDTSSTEPPILDLDNEWAGKSFEEVETFALANSDPDEHHELNFGNAVVVDEKGLQDGTCIIMARVMIWHEDSDEMEWPNKMNKVRLPWEDVGSMYVNLDISNMDWEDFVQDEEENMEGGWWRHKPVPPGNPRLAAKRQAAIAKRDAALRAFEELDEA